MILALLPLSSGAAPSCHMRLEGWVQAMRATIEVAERLRLEHVDNLSESYQQIESHRSVDSCASVIHAESVLAEFLTNAVSCLSEDVGSTVMTEIAPVISNIILAPLMLDPALSEELHAANTAMLSSAQSICSTSPLIGLSEPLNVKQILDQVLKAISVSAKAWARIPESVSVWGHLRDEIRLHRASALLTALDATIVAVGKSTLTNDRTPALTARLQEYRRLSESSDTVDGAYTRTYHLLQREWADIVLTLEGSLFHEEGSQMAWLAASACARIADEAAKDTDLFFGTARGDDVRS